MSIADASRSLKRTEAYGVRTLWDQRLSMPPRWAAGVAAFILILAYLPNLRSLANIWNTDANYNHGYLVIPIALFIFWQQLSSKESKTSSGTLLAPWWGWVFLIGIMLFRAAAYEKGLGWTEDATIIPAIAALTWSFGGWTLLRRVWPAIAYLVFMLPLPLAINNLLALPLQSFAATTSRFLLQLTGMWVIQEGNVINLTTAHGVERLDVALACNGLRMLMTMAATVTAIIILLPLPKWKRNVLFLSIIPIALVSNMARIVATGWSYYIFKSENARHWAHDWAGFLMMPLALALVGLELAILSWLVPKESADDKPVILLENMPKRASGKEKKKNQDLNEI
jgi:exosortase